MISKRNEFCCNHLQRLASWFELGQDGSSIRTEILAGVSTFLSLSYIFVVNPAILTEAGVERNVGFFATVAVSGLATMFMGLWGKMPFALAPGLEMNGYVAFVIVQSLGFSWEEALGAVFWSGTIMVIVTFSGVRKKIIAAIPHGLGLGLTASVGIFLMLIALRLSGILIYSGNEIESVGCFFSAESYVFYIGLFSVIALRVLKIRGSVLLSIVIAAVAASFWGLRISVEPVQWSFKMLDGIMALKFSSFLNFALLPSIVALFTIDFYGSVAKFVALSRNTSLASEDGYMRRMTEALGVDGLATVVGAAVGTSNVTTYVESAVGIREGGRTGLTAVISSLLMMSVLVFVPLINLVAVAATAGALFYVGTTILPSREMLKGIMWSDIAAILTMILVTAWTFALDKGMLGGFSVFIVLNLIAGRKDRISLYLLLSIAILSVGMAFR